MEQNINLLFENKIGCVANLMGFNDGQREILKTAAWMALNDMMIAQKKECSEDQDHIAQWILVIQIGKNVQTMLNINNEYTASDIWKDFEQVANGNERGNDIDNRCEGGRRHSHGIRHGGKGGKESALAFGKVLLWCARCGAWHQADVEAVERPSGVFPDGFSCRLPLGATRGLPCVARGGAGRMSPSGAEGGGMSGIGGLGHGVFHRPVAAFGPLEWCGWQR